MRNTLSNIGCLVTIALAVYGIYTFVSSPERQNQPVIPVVATFTPGPYPTLAVKPPFDVPGSSPEPTWTPEAAPTEGSTNTPNPFEDTNKRYVKGPGPRQMELASIYAASSSKER